MSITYVTKGETLTIRIDTRSRYGLDLLGRIKRRSVSELLIKEIREVIDKELPKREVGGEQVSLVDVVWDVFEQDRLVKLAQAAPELLTEHEQRLWRVISEDRTYLSRRGTPDFAAIRRDWKLIQRKVLEYLGGATEEPK